MQLKPPLLHHRLLVRGDFTSRWTLYDNSKLSKNPLNNMIGWAPRIQNVSSAIWKQRDTSWTKVSAGLPTLRVPSTYCGAKQVPNNPQYLWKHGVARATFFFFLFFFLTATRHFHLSWADGRNRGGALERARSPVSLLCVLPACRRRPFTQQQYRLIPG